MSANRAFRYVLCFTVGLQGGLLPVLAGSRDCPFPVPVHRPYRKEPEESEVALAALLGHFERHPYSDPGYPCLTAPGYVSPDDNARAALAQAGLKLSPDPTCRFGVGRIVWAAEGVWRVEGGVFVVHVTKLRFDDISTFLEGYEYTLSGDSEAGWTITRETQSACEPPQALSPEESPGRGDAG
jgi:hypothetical protein